MADDTLKTGDIAVETMDHVVYLTGTVPTEAQKATAEQIAHGVEGVVSVVNHLKIAAD